MFIDRKNGIGFVMLSNAVHPKRDLNEIIGYRNRLSNMIYKKSGGKLICLKEEF
jgi:hypothetical protein